MGVFFLIVNGVGGLAQLVISVLLLLKSRKPYKDACYLYSEDKLKIAIHVAGFIGLVSVVVYWGYILNFSVNMKSTPCN